MSNGQLTHDQPDPWHQAGDLAKSKHCGVQFEATAHKFTDCSVIFTFGQVPICTLVIVAIDIILFGGNTQPRFSSVTDKFAGIESLVDRIEAATNYGTETFEGCPQTD